MDVMKRLAQARPATLDSAPDHHRRADDLARAIATPRAAVNAGPSARSSSPRARRVAIGAAALASVAGAVAALSVTGTPTTRPQQAAALSGHLRNAILTAVSGVEGDVFYAKIAETYAGSNAKWDAVSQTWAYPLQPQAGQRARVRDLVTPSQGSRADSELIWTEPPGASSQPPVSKTKVIFVEYGSRTWSDTTAEVSQQSESGDLQTLREQIASGELTVKRTTEVDGQTVLELVPRVGQGVRGTTQTWWVNPVTDLPVRLLMVDPGSSFQVDYAFLPPTAANIAKVTVPIPVGFIRIPTIKG